jgi:uncharacterized OsmC-like protein
VDASGGRLTAEAVGEIETEGKVLILRRIHVTYQLKAPASAQETVERVHAVHAQSCPVYRSLQGAIAITTEYRLGAD